MSDPFAPEPRKPGRTASAKQALPEAFDWRTQGAVTSVKNQNPRSTCWIFASLADLESKVKLGETPAVEPDYSEQDVWEGNAPGISGVGHAKIVANHLAVYGTILESDNPYTPSDVPSTIPIPNYWNPLPGRPQKTITEWHDLGDLSDLAAVATLKSYVHDSGPVTTVMSVSRVNSWCASQGLPNFTSPSWDSAVVIAPIVASQTDHYVLIVGWDDTKVHYGGGGQGAWLVKNSYGPNWGVPGELGYFWIAYGSAGIGLKTSFFPRGGYKRCHSQERLMHYDEFGCWWQVGFSDDYDIHGLCCYTPTFALGPQYLKSVEFWAVWPNLQYEIRVWDNFDRGTRALSNPLGSTVNGQITDAGYYAIALPNPVQLTSGDEICIDVRFVNPNQDEYHLLGYEYAQPWFPNPIRTESNVCFFSSDGTDGSWQEASVYWGDLGIRGRYGPLGEEPEPTRAGHWTLFGDVRKEKPQ